MSERELYIGSPNGVVFCVDEPFRPGSFRGRLYHGYSADGEKIESFEEFIHVLTGLYDELQFPRAHIRVRSFSEREQIHRRNTRKERVMSDHELLAKHGDIGTFIIRVQQRQNCTWQGRITWVEKDKTMSFRSALEMIRLIESGISAGVPPEDRPEDRDEDWKQEQKEDDWNNGKD